MKIIKISFNTQDEKDAEIAEIKEQQLKRITRYEKCLADNEAATIVPDQTA